MKNPFKWREQYEVYEKEREVFDDSRFDWDEEDDIETEESYGRVKEIGNYYAADAEPPEEGNYGYTDADYYGDQDYAGTRSYAETQSYAGTRDYDAVDDDYAAAPKKRTFKSPLAHKSKERKAENNYGFLHMLRRRMAKMSVVDWMIWGSGAAVLIMTLVTGGFYLSSANKSRQMDNFISVGNQLSDIDLIGERGLLAVADAQLARMAAADAVADSQQEEDEGYQEEEYTRDVNVVLELVSIQRDLKIKFVNENTGRLVANVPFSVNITKPDGGSAIWSDDDMDGIIYKKDIEPGTYQVAMEILTDEKYSSYGVSTLATTVEVRKDIAYEKVEVANEIKTEDEVNASKEDTKVNETTVESSLKDTVAWVESDVLDAAYSEVPKSTIPDPATTIKTMALDTPFTRASASSTVSGGDRVKGTVTLLPATVSVSQGGSVTSQANAQGFSKDLQLTYSISPSSNQYADASIDNTGKITITGVATGTTQFIVTVNYATEGTTETAASAILNVTVTPPKTITLDKTTATAFIGEPLVLKATVSDMASPELKAVSQDNTVATVSVNQSSVTVNGLKSGVVTITVSLLENNVETAKAFCTVTVMENPKNDHVTLLKDARGNQLYVFEDGKYRKAVYADYYVESYKFYIQTEERYTGWQTINGKVYYYTAQGEKVTGEQVIQGAKYTFASDGSLVTGSGVLGIDVSKWNGNIDWNAVKNSGVNYVIIRCGYRGSSEGKLIEDPKFTANIKGATSAGLKVGVYFFTQAVDEREAVEEASMVLEQVKNYKISYPIFLDVESSGGRADSLDKATRTAVCKAFCQTIQNAGYTAGIYANKTWLENKLDAKALNSYKIWLAQYAASPTYTGRYDMWQYRSTGHVSGINGDVDMNISYLGY